ncbi:MAG: hypothetical protein MJ252_21330 [archaeon]|nr:hypothetical protein [archaeon]
MSTVQVSVEILSVQPNGINANDLVFSFQSSTGDFEKELTVRNILNKTS